MRIVAALVLMPLFVGCGSVEPDVETGDVATSDIVAPDPIASGAYRMERDVRRCAAPLCGGYFVSRVNQRTTVCADGTAQARCYVAEVRWAALGLSPSQLGLLQADAEQGRALLSGYLSLRRYDNFGRLGIFTPLKSWQAASDQTPMGTFFRAEDLRFVCVTYPCFNIRTFVINRSVPFTDVSGLDLTDVDGSTGEFEAAYNALRRGTLIVAGAIEEDDFEDPRGGRTLRGSQFYLPIIPRSQAE